MGLLKMLCLLLPALSESKGPSLQECQQSAQDVPSGRGGPSLTPAQASLDSSLYQEFSQNTYTSCEAQQDLYRSYRGAMTKDDKAAPPAGPCALGPECSFTKVNSIQASSCSELLSVRDALIRDGGYTAMCRHDFTDWTMKPQEDYACKTTGMCTVSEDNKRLQRQLSPAGLRRAKIVGESLKAAGVVIDSLHSSPFERCERSGLQVGAAYGLTEVEVNREELSSTTDYKDFERALSYSSLEGEGRSDVKKMVATSCREWLQTDWIGKTATGNRLAYTHSSNIGTVLDISLDEGDCAWVKPVDKVYSNIISDVVLSNTIFERVMSMDAKRVGLLAVLSPEQMQKMGQCSVLREELANDPTKGGEDSILTADTNQDLKITEAEFTKFCSSRHSGHSHHALWKIVLALQARPYWKSAEVGNEFLIGEHSYFNGGWRELVLSRGGWAFPWRKTTLDTIRPSVDEMKQVLAPLDYLLAIMNKIGIKEAKAVASCTPVLRLDSCAETLLSYQPIPTQGSADPVDTQEAPVAGFTYPYPTSIDIPDIPNPLFKLALCLVERGHVTEGRMRKMLGCEEDECDSRGERKKTKGRKKVSSYYLP